MTSFHVKRTLPFAFLLAACGGRVTEPEPEAHGPTPTLDAGGAVDAAPEERDGGADAGGVVDAAVDAGASCLDTAGGRVYNGTCRWQDGRCFNYYGWPEPETVESRTCAFAPWSTWSLDPCEETCACRARENADGSRTVVCGFP